MYADTPNSDIKPWFKQFWPWILIGIPGLTVVACGITIYLAIVTQDGLVDDDYYKSGLAINDALDRSKAAEDMGLSAYLRIGGGRDGGSRYLEVFFEAPAGSGPLTLKLLHPTRAHQDQILELIPSGTGHYTAQLPTMAPGNWYLSLSDDSEKWKISGRIAFPSHQDARLTP